jgi:hypothetical protein
MSDITKRLRSGCHDKNIIDLAGVEHDVRCLEAADILNQCKAAFEFIAQDGCKCDECSKARQMLAVIRGA